MRTVKIGIVGCGSISGIYLKNLTYRFKEMEIIGVCDLIRERAEKAVEEYKIPRLYEDMYELFADPDVDIVLNLTRPYEHFGVTSEALKAGKHVYSEKPLGATLEGGERTDCPGERKTSAHRRGSRYLHGGGNPDLPKTDRRRIHWDAGGRVSLYGLPRA